MNRRERYAPGAAAGARVEKSAGKWTLVVVRELRHPPERVWEALTDPAHLMAWAPFDADRNLGSVGPVKLSTVGTPMVAESVVTRAEAPRVLEFSWGGNELRWELAPSPAGTHLTLWHNIDKGYIAWGAAGWQVCFDVLEGALAGEPIGRIAGPEAMQFDGWQRLVGEYKAQFGE